jgi:ADP-ribosylglycohydrolase
VFAQRYEREPNRGYGPGAHQILESVVAGSDWRAEAESVFDDEGSFGNRAAMRAAPVGAYFADDLAAVVDQAEESAKVTHAHRQGIAGAVAVAVAAASMWQHQQKPAEIASNRLFEDVLQATEEGEVRDGILKAREYPRDADSVEVAADLGCGEAVTAMDTVPYVIWCASALMEDFENAMWETVKPGGDRDTTCAMVGGIVAMRADLPDRWLDHVEPLDW